MKARTPGHTDDLAAILGKPLCIADTLPSPDHLVPR